MRDLTLQRLSRSQYGIFGEMRETDGGATVCVTLEHNYGGLAKLAAGTYTCMRHAPNRLPYETFEVMGVPNFQGKPVTGILFHVLNFDRESLGCVGVGDFATETMIHDSQAAFHRLMALEADGDRFRITVLDIAA